MILSDFSNFLYTYLPLSPSAYIFAAMTLSALQKKIDFDCSAYS